MSNMNQHEIQQNLVRSGAKYIDSAKQDILTALQQFSSLKADTESFLFPDGKRRNAVFLSGTIPVPYRGSSYNIPVKIYLWDTHPYYAPLCFVKPTSDMVIKESESVNKEGRVFLPYLNEWRFPGYDLNGLLQVMIMIFQERCPVFAKSALRASSTQPAANTPYPAANPPSMPTPYPTNNQNYNPTTTPYPNAGTNQFPSPYSNTGQFTGSGYRPAPPVPGPPVDHIRESLLSALQDKIKLRLRDHLGTKSAEMASISETKRDLQAGQTKLKQIVQELERNNTELMSYIAVHESKRMELIKALAETGDGSQKLDIDTVLDAGNPLLRQLFNNYTQDLACEDEIYVLGQAKIRGAISLQDYLRHVRAVSRRQFEYRATMQKCRRVAGLPV